LYDSNRKYSLWLQVSARLADLEATLEAEIRHRNKALASVGGPLTIWMDMVRISFWIHSGSLWCICKAFLIPYQPLQGMHIYYEPTTLILIILCYVRRENTVYDTLNMLNFDVTKKCLVGEGWCLVFANIFSLYCLLKRLHLSIF